MATVFRAPSFTRRWPADPAWLAGRSQDGVQSSRLLTTLQRGAVQFFTGFETGDASEITGLGASTTAVQPGIVRSGAYALKQANNSSTISNSLSLATSVVRLYAKFPIASNNYGFSYGNGSIAVFAFVSGTVMQISGNGISTTNGTITVTDNAWHRFELVVDSAAGGIVQLLVDGIIDVNVTHTGAYGNLTILTVSGAAAPNECYFDDFLIVSGLIPPGPGQVIARQGKPGTPTYDSWTKNGAATSWAAWSDTSFNTASNTTDSTNADAQTMLVAPFSATQAGHGPQTVLAGDAITAAKTAIVGKTAISSTAAKIRRRINGTDTDTGITYSTSDKYFDDGVWTTTADNLDLLEVGVVHGTDSNLETVEDVWVIVDFATPSPSTTVTGTPFNQYDWPNPKHAPYRLRDWQSSPNIALTASIAAPFFQLDWPVPKHAPYRLRDWQQPPNTLIKLLPGRLVPFYQSDWPLPKIAPYPITNRSRDPQNPLLLPLAKPFNQRDWPLPKVAPHPISNRRNDPQAYPGRIPVQMPFNQRDWPNPKAPYFQLREWQRPPNTLLVVLNKPFNQQDWPVPKHAPYRLRDWQQPPNTQITTLPGSRTTPFAQLDWPLPKPPLRGHTLGTWVQGSPAVQELSLIKPFNLSDWPLPNRGAAQFIRGWIQPKPTYYRDAPPFAGNRRGFPRLPRQATNYQIVDAINRIISGLHENPFFNQIEVVTDDFSISFPPNQCGLILNPAGALSLGQVTLPVDAIDMDRIWIVSTQNITSFTLNPGSGQTILNGPTSLSAGASISYVYVASNLSWYRLQ